MVVAVIGYLALLTGVVLFVLAGGGAGGVAIFIASLVVAAVAFYDRKAHLLR